MTRISRVLAIWLIAALAVMPWVRAQDAPPPAPFKAEEIEQLVAPIALYPDALVAQILMASTYPLEVVSAARWSKANPNIKGKELEDAMQKQTWEASVKSLTAFPQVLTMLNEKLDMTQKLGDAFLGQQKDVMAAIQRLRAKADKAGNLKSSKEQTVTSAQEGGQTVIKIDNAGGGLSVGWTEQPAVKPLVEVRGAMRVDVHANHVSAEAALSVRSRGEPINSFVVYMPQGMELTSLQIPVKTTMPWVVHIDEYYKLYLCC